MRLSQHLTLEDINPSIGAMGDAYRNALMKTVFGLFKADRMRTTVFHAGPYRALADVEYATTDWVDWYHSRYLHRTLGMLTPVEFEPLHH